jgi:hypothetical protein
LSVDGLFGGATGGGGIKGITTGLGFGDLIALKGKTKIEINMLSVKIDYSDITVLRLLIFHRLH